MEPDMDVARQMIGPHTKSVAEQRNKWQVLRQLKADSLMDKETAEFIAVTSCCCGAMLVSLLALDEIMR